MNVLIIEDNMENLYLVTYLLEQHGHRVAAARDAPSGIDLAAEGDVDLILLDIQLPGMDGYATARALKALPAGNTPPIVAVTSFAMPEDRDRAMAAGCDAFLEKPIDPDDFVARVEAIAKGRR